MKQGKLTYNRLILSIILISLLFSLISTIAYSFYLKRHAIEELARDEAKKTSLLVFENLYTAMSKGVAKDEMSHIIERLNLVDTNLDINVYRSPKVVELFGDDAPSRDARAHDALVQRAMKGEELLYQHADDYIRYLYPISATDKCKKCHVNVSSGDINGVIDLRYNISSIRISLNALIKSLITFFLIFMGVIFIFIYLNLKHNVVNPIGTFITSIKGLMTRQDLSKRVSLDTRIREIKDIESFFNQLLESLQLQFYSDQLTGLPNRRRIFVDLKACRHCSIAVINIDAFNEINDFYGNNTGDMILIRVGELLREAIHSEDCQLYRLGGDEFAVLTQDSSRQELFEVSLQRILKLFSESFTIENGQEISLGITMGAANGGEDILIKANVALKQARKLKKNYLIYDDSMFAAEEYENNIRWSANLKAAIAERRLTAFYQPIVNNQTGKIEKYETLIRLIDEDGSIVSPYFFLDVAKKAKLYSHITRIVLEEAFTTFKDTDYEFSINISVDDIKDEITFAQIEQNLRNNPDTAKRAVFELLESEGVENYQEVIRFINMVKGYGAMVAVDDFGTGYSNFEHLLELKVDYIKIDAVMIKNIDKAKNSELVTETIVEFAKKLGIKTIGEFVHSKEVYEKVKDIGVDYSQGYYFGEPQKALKTTI